MQQPPPPPAAAAAERWFVSVPNTFEALAEQTRRSTVGAARQGGHRRVLVEASAPELDPSSGACRLPELVRFAQDVAQPLVGSGLLPASLPMVKLLFASSADATFAGASVMDTSLPVSVLGHENAVGPRDGAFVVVAPSARPSEPQLATDAAVEAALSRLMTVAAGRLVVLINPRLGGDSAILESFEPAYFMRPLSLAYLKDQYAKQVDRVRCCLVRCYPHEWSVLYESEGAWRYAGRFEQQPLAEELEAKLRESITKERNGRLRQQEQGAGES